MRVSKSAASFIFIVLIALSWRCAGITFDSLWLDEGYQSIIDAYGRPVPDFLEVPAEPFIYNPGTPAPPSEMLQNFRKVDPLTPPLYQLLLNRWIAVFGGSDLALRLLSVLISTAGVAALFFFVHRVFGLRTAVVVGLLQAFSGFGIHYGQEVRMYALVELAATVSCGGLILLLLHYLRGSERIAGWCAYVVATWAAINSHYTSLFLVAYQGALGLFCALVRRSARLFALLVTAWISVGILWLPWWQMFRQAAAMRTASFYVAREASLWWPFYALFVRIPYNWIAMLGGKHTYWAAAPLYVTSSLALLLGFMALPKLGRRPRLAAAMIVGWLVVPAVVLWGLDVVENHRVIEMPRYVMATAPAAYIIAGLGLSRLVASIRWRRMGLLLLAVHLLFSAVNNVAHFTVNYQREGWRLAAQKLEQTVPQDELVLVAQHYNIVCLDRYLTKPYRQVGVDSITADSRVNEIIGGLQRFTLITGQEGNLFAQKVPAQFKLVEQVDFPHGLHFRRYSR